MFENRCFFLVELDDIGVVAVVDEGLDVVLCFIVQVFVVHIDGVERVVEEVADEGGGAVEFAGDFAGCLCGGEAIGQGAPVVGELLDVYLEFFGGAALSEGAHDDAEVLGFQSSGDLAEPFAFSAPFDFLGEEHFVAVGDEHAVAAGEGDTRSDAWPFGGNALLAICTRMVCPVVSTFVILPTFSMAGWRVTAERLRLPPEVTFLTNSLRVSVSGQMSR